MEGEGHFVALLKKQGESRKRQPSRLWNDKEAAEEAEEFLAGVRMDWKNGSFALVKDQLYFCRKVSVRQRVCAICGPDFRLAP